MSQLNKLLLSIALLFCIEGNAQFYLGTTDSVFSNEYKENRNFLVYLPTEVRDKKIVPLVIQYFMYLMEDPIIYLLPEWLKNFQSLQVI